MKNITVDRRLVKEIQTRIQSAMQQIAGQYGMQAVQHGASYHASGMHTKVELILLPTNGKSVEQEAFERECGWHGLKPSDWGRKFTFAGDRFEICGIKSRARRNPVVARRCGTNTRYVFPVHAVNPQVPIPAGRRRYSETPPWMA